MKSISDSDGDGDAGSIDSAQWHAGGCTTVQVLHSRGREGEKGEISYYLMP
jgi:hypothetical protein